MRRGSLSWKEDGCRNDCTTLVGLNKRSFEGVTKKKARRNIGWLYHCPTWREVRDHIPENLRKWEQRAKTSKKEWKWQRGITSHCLKEGKWTKSHLMAKKWESEKHRSWSMPVEGFRNHVATDGSLLGESGRWGCMWMVSGAARSR